MFRGIVSVLQVAGTFVLVMGFAAQSTPVGAAFRGDEWAARLLLDPSELFVGAILIVPAWLDILFFGIADRTLRTCGLLKDPIQYDPKPLRVSAGSLQALWLGQILSRFANLAAHVALAAILSTAVIFVMRSMWRGVEPLI